MDKHHTLSLISPLSACRHMTTLLILAISALLPLAAQADCAILLHGLARSETSMNTLAKALSDADYHVVNTGYPSREATIETLAQQVIPPAIAQCKSQPIHFVTHSMGAILVRYYLQTYSLESLGRVVMLGPPNQGSEVIDRLGQVPGFHFINGDAGLQLGTGQLSLPNQLGDAHFDVGIIAGNWSVNWILSSIIPGADDGKVSVERTKLNGMNDHITLPVTHTFMMSNKKVIKQVLHYLAQGTFIKPTAKVDAHTDQPTPSAPHSITE